MKRQFAMALLAIALVVICILLLVHRGIDRFEVSELVLAVLIGFGGIWLAVGVADDLAEAKEENGPPVEGTTPKLVLAGVDLQEAVLVRATLVHSDLVGARLVGADLRGADLRGADLSRADLHRADLRGADLRGALTDSAQFEDAIDDSATKWSGEPPPGLIHAKKNPGLP